MSVSLSLDAALVIAIDLIAYRVRQTVVRGHFDAKNQF
jgi:hypothetical protein